MPRTGKIIFLYYNQLINNKIILIYSHELNSAKLTKNQQHNID
ncbi:hypothetical protein XBI1_2970015 [Xenorhabdus bovienii str. Intermedium]|uniref:Uncharacterized protein n=1 Tax=Xenorhabdus bovienii str. Intermedium TaxID=1379677 RepID=A0A077QKU9_XENBV|nr:hypothetical protein XBI1_2970015 [Xenorhabdus bovienii str. Intermedium]